MLYIGSISQIDRAAQSAALDEVWLIVRSLKGFSSSKIPNVYHVPVLSPSYPLFRDYLSWKANGVWNEQTFVNSYVPRFLMQMHGFDERDKLNMLYSRIVYSKKNIMLACFCKDEQLCHRSIIAGLMNGVGVNTYDANGLPVTYASYYTQYRAMEEGYGQ